MRKRNQRIQQKNRCCHHHHRQRWIRNRHLEGWNPSHRSRYQKQGNSIRPPQPERNRHQGLQSQRCWWLRQKTRIIQWSLERSWLDHWEILNHPTTRRPRSCLSRISQNRRIQPNLGPRLDRLNLLPSCLRKGPDQVGRIERITRPIHPGRYRQWTISRRWIRCLITRTRGNQSHRLWRQGRCWNQISPDPGCLITLRKNLDRSCCWTLRCSERKGRQGTIMPRLEKQIRIWQNWQNQGNRNRQASRRYHCHQARNHERILKGICRT